MAYFRLRACSCMWCSHSDETRDPQIKEIKDTEQIRPSPWGGCALVLNSREELLAWRYMRRLGKTHRTMWSTGVQCITKGGEQLDSLSETGWTSRSTGASRKHLTRISIGAIPALQERQSCPSVGRKKQRVSSFSKAETIVLGFCLIIYKVSLRNTCTKRTLGWGARRTY